MCSLVDLNTGALLEYKQCVHYINVVANNNGMKELLKCVALLLLRRVAYPLYGVAAAFLLSFEMSQSKRRCYFSILILSFMKLVTGEERK